MWVVHWYFAPLCFRLRQVTTGYHDLVSIFGNVLIELKSLVKSGYESLQAYVINKAITKFYANCLA